MPVFTDYNFSLDDERLAKLSDDSAEIRMFSFEQVETSFMHCLINGGAKDFKPLLLFEQLIRWFSFTPIKAPDRVLALIFELLRSKYACDICYNALDDLDKIRQQLETTENVPRKRCLDLLEALSSQIKEMYCMTPSSGASDSSDIEFSIEFFQLQPDEDLERAWSTGSHDDLITQATIVDGLSFDNDELLQQQILNIEIKICDYPVEYMLQPPHIFLRLMHVQQFNKSYETQRSIYRALLTIVKQFQRGISDRCNVRNYAKTKNIKSTQLSIASALRLLLKYACLERIQKPEGRLTFHFWRCFELTDEVIQTYVQLNVPIPSCQMQQLEKIVSKYLVHCKEIDVSHEPDTQLMSKILMKTRLKSILCNEFLLKAIRLSASFNECRTDGILLDSLFEDNVYWICMPQRLDELCKLHNQFEKTKSPIQEDLVRFKEKIKLSIGQLLSKTKLSPPKLLRSFYEICSALMHLGSKSLVEQLVEAIVKCTSLFITQPDLRIIAQTLLMNLFGMTLDAELHSYTLQLLKKPVTDHFNALVIKTSYLPGCSNIKLIRNHILGLPMSTSLLKELLIVGWQPWHSALRQWCIEYLMMLLGMIKLIPAREIAEVFELVRPLLPLLVYRSIDQPELHRLLWELLEPNGEYLDRLVALNGNVCFLFHPDKETRRSAIVRVAFCLNWQHGLGKGEGLAINIRDTSLVPHDLFIVHPPIDYSKALNMSLNNPQFEKIDALLSLLSLESVVQSSLPHLNNISIVLRYIFLQPESEQRCYGSTVLFLSAFRDYIVIKTNTPELQINLSALLIPFKYNIKGLTQPARELPLHKTASSPHYLHKRFHNPQYWRLFFAHSVCGSLENLSPSAMRELDIGESLKLKPSDLALIHASQLQRQFEKLLNEETNHCDSQLKFQYVVCYLNLFLIHLRDDITPDSSNRLWLFMEKYLRVLPSHCEDINCYTVVLDLCLRCLRIRLPDVHQGLQLALRTEPNHSFLEVLQSSEVSLNILLMVTQCLVVLISNTVCSETVVCTLHQLLFVKLSRMARTHFELRQLQHLRCLLSVLRELSDKPLCLHELNVEAHYQHFVQLSKNIKTNTHTGAQMQRDCLLIICQLQSNSELKPTECYLSKGKSKVLRYLISLTNQRDREVRALGWTALANWCQSAGCNIIPALLNLNKYLPAVLRDRCLSTLLNSSEVMIVRELAGRLFEMLMTFMLPTDIISPLEQFSFLKEASLPNSALLLASTIPLHCNRSIARHSCEIMSCYVAICTRLTVIEPKWHAKLCDSPFFQSLTEIMNLNIPKEKFNKSYMNLCAGDICKLFARCHQLNKLFIQRTICRSPMMLQNFYGLIDMGLKLMSPLPENCHVEMLKLLMVFLKENNSCSHLVSFRPPNLRIIDLILQGLRIDNVEGAVMRYSLSTLLLLLNRSLDPPLSDDIILLFNEYVEMDKVVEEPDTKDDNNSCKENSTNPICQQLKMFSLKPQTNRNVSKPKKAKQPTTKLNGTMLIYQRLDELFEKYYPTGEYSFTKPYTKNQVKVCEVLSKLLQVLPQAMKAAVQNKLLHRIIQHLEAFNNKSSFKIPNDNVSDSYQKHATVYNLSVVINILINWHAAPHAAITDSVLAMRLVCVLTRLWHWFSDWMMLVNLIIRLMTVITECSLIICKQASQAPCDMTHSLLQRMVDLAVQSMSNDSLPPGDMLHGALRVMNNCCACFEGRMCLDKMGVLSMMDKVLNPNVKPEVQNLWLRFWETFSRYEYGSKICHIDELISTIKRLSPLSVLRLRCLRILRNMCFDSGNRIRLLGSTEFMGLLRDIVLKTAPVQEKDPDTHSYVEQYLVLVCLLSLFSVKDKHREMFRDSEFHQKMLLVSFYLVATAQNEHREKFKKFAFAYSLIGMMKTFLDLIQSDVQK